jgi:tetratricopeptide (TPR) repeat protein
MNKMTDTEIVLNNVPSSGTLDAQASSSALASIQPKAHGMLLCMFANPYLLEKDERAELVAQLRECVAQHPKVSELRVLFGMALCVNLEIHSAMEELDEAVALDPNSFMAHFKAGELWMRLRVMNKAENHTHQAAKLAQNLAQSEMARRQAAAIRAMKQGGIERGGYMGVWSWVTRLRRLWTRNRSETTVALDVS